MRTQILAAASAFLLTAALHAQTTIPGGNITTQTWTTAGSPYTIQGDVIIPAGNTLTIQPGVLVQFTSTDSQAAGINTTKPEFTVRGTLNAQGTQAAPIIFQAQTGVAANTWYGIVVDNAAASVTLRDAIVRHAVSALRLSANPATISTGRLSLTTSNTGLEVNLQSLATPILDGITSTGNLTGVSVVSASGLTLRNSFIASNTGTGVLANAGSSSSVTTLLCCTIANNASQGVYSAFLGGVNASGCIITGNALNGVLRTSGSVTISYSDVWNNGTNYANVTPSIGCISLNPLFASPAGPNILLGSPCIDTANPGNFPAADIFGNPRPIDGDSNGTSTPDMGAHEFSCGAPISFSLHPTPQTAVDGGPATFHVTATALTYQWRRNGVPLPNGRDVSGATTDTLTIGRTGPYDAGSYDVLITNNCTSLASTPAALTITPASPCGSSDFNGDGDYGTDADIEAFFRILGGGPC